MYFAVRLECSSGFQTTPSAVYRSNSARAKTSSEYIPQDLLVSRRNIIIHCFPVSILVTRPDTILLGQQLKAHPPFDCHTAIMNRHTSLNASQVSDHVSERSNKLTLSTHILSQAEGARTEFHTINFARLACSEIRMATLGQRFYNNCFANLLLFRSADSRLQFGWGEDHLSRQVGFQHYEYEHLLLASALGEFLSEACAAAVFSALAECFEDDQLTKPHISSFQRFVRAANGILSTSEFPQSSMTGSE